MTGEHMLLCAASSCPSTELSGTLSVSSNTSAWTPSQVMKGVLGAMSDVDTLWCTLSKYRDAYLRCVAGSEPLQLARATHWRRKGWPSAQKVPVVSVSSG